MLDEALRLFGLTGAPARIIRHNENLTCRVDGQYLLRIHRPKTGVAVIAAEGWPDPLTLRRSELMLLEHLHAAGLHVQRPVPAVDGSCVALLSDGTPVTLLTWLDGSTPDAKSATAETYRAAGAMLARLHAALRDCPPLPARRYDEALALHLRDTILSRQGEGGLDRQSAADIARCCEGIGRVLRQCEAEFQLIHGDVDPSNIVITPHGMSPIDFSLFGYGHPMMDFAALASTVQGEPGRQALAEGYRAEGGCVSRPLLDAFYAMNLILCIVLHLDEWLDKDWFPAALIRWRGVFDPFLSAHRG